MDLDDFNPAALIMGAIGGLFGVFVASSMTPGNILMYIMVFAVCSVAGYFVAGKILES